MGENEEKRKKITLLRNNYLFALPCGTPVCLGAALVCVSKFQIVSLVFAALTIALIVLSVIFIRRNLISVDCSGITTKTKKYEWDDFLDGEVHIAGGRYFFDSICLKTKDDELKLLGHGYGAILSDYCKGHERITKILNNYIFDLPR